MATRLAAKELAALDPYEFNARAAGVAHLVTVEQGDFFSLGYDDETFDVALALVAGTKRT